MAVAGDDAGRWAGALAVLRAGAAATFFGGAACTLVVLALGVAVLGVVDSILTGASGSGVTVVIGATSGVGAGVLVVTGAGSEEGGASCATTGVEESAKTAAIAEAPARA